MTTDSLYTTSLAHRSIARAALHLGIEGMETKALEALGGVLIDYLERIGSRISTSVELSGRSSAHVNVYDVLNAIEECTFPAADQLAASTPAASLNGAQNGGGWEGLASFLFGPDWYLIPLEGEDVTKRNGGTQAKTAETKKPGGKSMSSLISSANAANITVPSGAGKQLPRLAASASATADKNVSFNFDRSGSIGGGMETNATLQSVPLAGRWNAPYPENVPAFPTVATGRSVANPHRLTAGKSLHDLASEREACRAIPLPLKRKASDGTSESKKIKKLDNVAAAAEEKATREALKMSDAVCVSKDLFYWGCVKEDKEEKVMDSMGDVKMADVEGEDKKPVVESKAKVQFSTTASATAKKEVTVEPSPSSVNKAPYVPAFLPTFPPTQENIERDRQLSVSSSKVMGSVLSNILTNREKRKPPTNNTEVKETKPSTETVRQSVIDLGKSSYWGCIHDETKDTSLGVSSGLEMKEGTKKVQGESQVNPLGRASGSRVSKILEGSMS